MKIAFLALSCLIAAAYCGPVSAQPPADAPPAVPAPLPQPKHDLSTPEATVRSFLAALTLRDVDRALACVYKANTRKRGPLVKRMKFGEEFKENWIVQDIAIKTGIASHMVVAAIKMRYERMEKGKMIGWDTEEELELYRDRAVGGNWLLLAGSPVYQWTAAQGGGLRMAVTEIVHPEVYENWFKCESGLEGSASSVLYIVKERFGGVFAIKAKAAASKTAPGDAAKWSFLKQALMPELRVDMGLWRERMFVCPEDADKAGTESYAFNEMLDGLAVGDIIEPRNTVMLYEGNAGKLAFRHDGKAAVAFVDGHAELIGIEEAKTLAWVAKMK